MVPGVHFLHVSLHFFHVFLSLHLPFFLSFLHFLVEILSLQLAPRIEFSEITTEKNDMLGAIINNVGPFFGFYDPPPSPLVNFLLSKISNF